MVVVDLTMVEKDLRRVPGYIRNKLFLWAKQVSFEGLEKVRKTSSWHDERLKGKRSGQRSIRLSKSYRAIYLIEHDTQLIVVVIEVNKHRY